MNRPSLLLEIPFGSECYREILTQRDQILRRPLGLVLTEEDCEGEEDHRHFALRDGENLVAGVIAQNAGPESIRFRQMWVEASRQGQGFGRQLLGEVEKLLAGEGIRQGSLHARLHVKAFYEACGYAPVGEVFEEIGIPHVRMTKHLAPETSG